MCAAGNRRRRHWWNDWLKRIGEMHHPESRAFDALERVRLIHRARKREPARVSGATGRAWRGDRNRCFGGRHARHHRLARNASGVPD